MCARRVRTWKEKLQDSKDLPKVMEIEASMTARWGRGTVALPSPMEVDALMKAVPKGKVMTTAELRQAVADKHKATIGCPMVTGIFAWIAANAAEEARAAGESSITPYWRTLKTGGELNPKFPGGIDAVEIRLKQEGHQILRRGKRAFVANYEQNLYRPGTDEPKACAC